jgi:AcrR family transcriptional regulator
VSPIIVDKEEKKKEIFSAAAAVFAENGFSGTRMEDVARRADMGKGTLYEYFKSKDDLFFALYQNLLEEFHRKIYSVLSPEQKPSESIAALLNETLKAFEEWEDFGILLLDFWNEHRRGRFLQVEFSKVYDKSRGLIRELIEEGITQGEFEPMDSWVMSSTIIAVLDGMLLQRVFDPELYSKVKVEKHLSGILFNGLLKR